MSVKVEGEEQQNVYITGIQFSEIFWRKDRETLSRV